MLEDEMKNLWRKSSQQELIQFDVPKLKNEMKNRLNQIDRNIKARDNREIAAATLGIFVFGYFAFVIPFPVTKAACVFAVFVTAYIIYKFRSARKKLYPVDLSLPFRDQLEQQKMFLLKQKKLVSSAFYWYVLPPFLMNVVFILGIGDPGKYNWTPRLLHLLPLTMDDKISTLISLTIFWTFIAWINRRAAKKNYTPVIQDLERMQRQLDASS